MASITGASLKFTSLSNSFKQTQVFLTVVKCDFQSNMQPHLSSCSVLHVPLREISVNYVSFPSLRTRPGSLRFRVSCAAKPETVKKVCEIVKKQLALPDDSSVTGEAKFAALGADSLDTVEIVMALEEEFGVSVEEESAQSIATIEDAADLVDKLVEKKNNS